MKTMYSIALWCLGLMLFFVPILDVGAQDMDLSRLLGGLSIDEHEATEIGRIQGEYREQSRLPHAELDVVRASITRELVRKNPSLQKIEEMIRSGLEFEVSLRLAEIRRELAMQELLGPQGWSRFKQIARAMLERSLDYDALVARLQQSRPEAVRILRLIQQYAQ